MTVNNHISIMKKVGIAAASEYSVHNYTYTILEGVQTSEMF